MPGKGCTFQSYNYSIFIKRKNIWIYQNLVIIKNNTRVFFYFSEVQEFSFLCIYICMYVYEVPDILQYFKIYINNNKDIMLQIFLNNCILDLIHSFKILSSILSKIYFSFFMRNASDTWRKWFNMQVYLKSTWCTVWSKFKYFPYG